MFEKLEFSHFLMTINNFQVLTEILIYTQIKLVEKCKLYCAFCTGKPQLPIYLPGAIWRTRLRVAATVQSSQCVYANMQNFLSCVLSMNRLNNYKQDWKIKSVKQSNLSITTEYKWLHTTQLLCVIIINYHSFRFQKITFLLISLSLSGRFFDNLFFMSGWSGSLA